ncbi:hypothetical protein OQA88_13298 [Cercophora sp. LCS_1]
MASYEQIVVGSDKNLEATPIQRSEVGKTPWFAIAWRFLLVILFAVSIVIVLHMYQQKGSLSSDDRRWFNALTLLFTALISLSVGSLLGLLGSMIRWPLLATRSHSPRDVDLVLGMPEATGTLRLLWFRSVSSEKWTVTTLVALLYLVINTLGRLSVASIGLAFDVNENVSAIQPIRLSDWNSSDWFDLQKSVLYGTESDYYSGYFKVPMAQMQEFASLGMLLIDSAEDIKMRGDEDFELIAQDKNDIGVPGFNRRIVDETVTYSYGLRERQGGEEFPSQKRVVQSSARCIPRAVSGNTVYQWGQMPMAFSSNITKQSPVFLEVWWRFNEIVERNINTREAISNEDPVWAYPVNWTAFTNTALGYILFRTSLFDRKTDDTNTAIYECTTCLSGLEHLHNLRPENASYISNMLLNHAAMNGRDYFPKLGSPDRNASIVTQIHRRTRPGSGAGNTFTFLADVTTEAETPEDYDALMCKPARGNDDGIRTRRYAMNVAHHAARAPLLPIIGAERTLPVVNEVLGQQAETVVTIGLAVKWERVFLVLGLVLGGTAVAVGGAVAACRGVPMQDVHSHLTVACLLRGAVGVADFKGWRGMMLRYAAKRDEGIWEVGLWVEGAEVVDGFPEGEYRPGLWSETSGNGSEGSEVRKRANVWQGGEDSLRSPDPMMGAYMGR